MSEATMINWVIGLFVAALAAAFLGFSGTAAAFAEVARVVFCILLVSFVVSGTVALAGSRALGMPAFARTMSLVAAVSALSIGAYAWVDNDMSAERVGAIDRHTVAIADTAGAAVSDAGKRTGTLMERTVTDLRTDAHERAQRDTSSEITSSMFPNPRR
ncbi:MAG: hypothetical protein SGJ23_03000 [Alphaproteobacteria bacterium]|nr:hypothetical protein [Alphaproteobacteria bacterium]